MAIEKFSMYLESFFLALGNISLSLEKISRLIGKIFLTFQKEKIQGKIEDLR